MYPTVYLGDVCPLGDKPECLLVLDRDDGLLLFHEEILAISQLPRENLYLKSRNNKNYLQLYFEKLLQSFFYHEQYGIKFTAEIIPIFREFFSSYTFILKKFNFFVDVCDFNDLVEKQMTTQSSENLNLLIEKALSIELNDINAFKPEWVVYFSKIFARIAFEILKTAIAEDISTIELLEKKAYDLAFIGIQRARNQEFLTPGFNSITPKYIKELGNLSQKIQALKNEPDYSDELNRNRKRVRFFCPEEPDYKRAKSLEGDKINRVEVGVGKYVYGQRG